jgi:hypothetical protein
MPARTSRRAEILRFAISILLTIATVAAMIHFVVISLRASHFPTPTETHVLRLRGHGLYFSDAGWRSVKRDGWIVAGSAVLMFCESFIRAASGRNKVPESETPARGP